MDPISYEIEAKIEATHWWFVGRRKLFSSIIQELALDLNSSILDIGTSTGTNLRMLRELGFNNVVGVDLSEEAIRWCAEKKLGNVKKGNVYSIPSESDFFRLILATDIIEHVEDDVLALNEILRVMKPGGYGIITVPAFLSLWGLQDEVSHHKHRYRSNELKQKMNERGFILQEIFYFNYFLFLPIWLIRKIINIFQLNIASENQINSPWINSILTQVFIFDILSARKIHPPFGVSLFALVRKK